MKKILFLAISGIFLFSCNQKNEAKPTEVEKEAKVETQNFDWLLGEWKRNNEEKGKETFENWKKINNSEYNGIGFTLKNKDTLSKEEMKIVEKNGEWN